MKNSNIIQFKQKIKETKIVNNAHIQSFDNITAKLLSSIANEEIKQMDNKEND